MGATGETAKGRLHKATTDAGYVRGHAYDALGRPAETALTLEPGVEGRFAYAWDAQGRLAAATRPSGLALRHAYTALGLLEAVDAAGAPGDPGDDVALWSVEARDAAYQWDKAGFRR